MSGFYWPITLSVCHYHVARLQEEANDKFSYFCPATYLAMNRYLTWYSSFSLHMNNKMISTVKKISVFIDPTKCFDLLFVPQLDKEIMYFSWVL